MNKPSSPDQSLALMELEDHHITPLVTDDILHYPLGKWTPKAGELHEMMPGVYWLRMPLPMSLDHINLYILEDGDGIAIVDTGLATEASKAHWDTLFAGPLAGRKVNRIIVTHYHPDHLGLAGWLCRKFAVPLWMSRGEFLLARTLMLGASDGVPDEVVQFYIKAGWSDQAIEHLKVAGWGNFSKIISTMPQGFVRMKAGDALRIGAHNWTCMVGSGHSPEHICLYQPELAVLIAGDQLLPRISSNISVFPIEPEANPLQDWFDSLDMLSSHLPEETLVLPSHNEPFRGIQIRAQKLRESHQAKLDRLMAHIEIAPRTAIDCFEILFRRKLSGSEYMMATGEALAHLHYLKECGKLEQSLSGHWSLKHAQHCSSMA
jgi:glyoxylase-like metal-dependent hydrolase (beta-lactamase superfamily II)